jgi:hypothetical protein
MLNLSTLKKTIEQKYQTNVRAEAFVAELLENDIPLEQIITLRKGGFRQRFSNDIDSVQRNSLDYLNGDQFTLLLNRDSMYDKLPEGLFHQTKGGTYNRSLENMLAEHRQYKEEEKYARKFFSPLEHEFFTYAVEIELEERRMMRSMLSGEFTSSFYTFWDIDDRIPRAFAAIMIKMIPWIPQIMGHREATRKALELMSGQSVSLEEQILTTQTAAREGLSIGSGMLGTDSVLGHSYDEASLQWIFRFHHLDEVNMACFVHDPAYRLFLQRFEDLFIPLETEVIFNFEQSHEIQKEQYLGHDFVLA